MIIYKIKNIVNNKVYIGQTTHKLKHRWNQHIYVSKKLNHYFAKAIKKYGSNNFTISELERCNSIDELNNKEQIWIAIYNSSNAKFGYNGTLGGENRIPNNETRKKLSNINKGRVVSIETRKRQSDSHKGKKLTEEQKKKIGKAHLGRKVTDEFRKKMSTIRTGQKLTKETKRKISEACKAENLSDITRKKMSDAQKGRKHTEETKRKIGEGSIGRGAKVVIQYDKNNNFIKEWKSMSAIEKELNIYHSNVSLACSGKYKSAGGFIWKYK